MQDEAAYNAVGKSFRQALNMAMGTTRQISESLLDYQVCRSSPPSPRLPPLASLPLPPCPRPRPRTLVCARMVWAGFLALCLRVLLVACVCLSRGACSARW